MQHLHPASASPSRSSFASASKRSPIARSPLSLSSSSNKRNSPSASPAPAPVPTPAFTEAVNPYTKGRLRRRKTMRDNELTSFFTQGLAGVSTEGTNRRNFTFYGCKMQDECKLITFEHLELCTNSVKVPGII
eukprot:g70429.t1